MGLLQTIHIYARLALHALCFYPQMNDLQNSPLVQSYALLLVIG